jgi:hypothetical protein
MDTFINRYFPNLSELEVNRWPRNERVLHLPSLNLNVFWFSAYYDSPSAGIPLYNDILRYHYKGLVILK